MEFLTSLEFGKLIWLILGVFEVIVRLTPSQADNSILNKVIWIVEKLVPNKSSDSKNNDKFIFEGFPPRKKQELEEISQSSGLTGHNIFPKASAEEEHEGHVERSRRQGLKNVTESKKIKIKIKI